MQKTEKSEQNLLHSGGNLQSHTIDVPENWSEGDYEYDPNFEAQIAQEKGADANNNGGQNDL